MRNAGDAVIAAFFSADKPKARETRRAEIESWFAGGSKDLWDLIGTSAAELQQAERPLHPFHWELEFPEVFELENSGFDAIVATIDLEQTLVCSAVTARLGFVLVPRGTVCAHTVNVFALDTLGSFAAMQSRVHEEWSIFFSSSLEDRFRYTPTDCFETFPFPENWVAHPALERAGKAYYEFRAALMIKKDEGLTKTYNRFHDPDERVQRS